MNCYIRKFFNLKTEKVATTTSRESKRNYKVLDYLE